MKPFRGRLGVPAMLAVIILVAVSCSTKRPAWYLNPPEGNDTFYGTGASERTQSLSLGKQVADANARTDLANSIQMSVQSMLHTLLQQRGDMEASRALQFSETVSKQVADVKLTGVVITQREEVDGIFYSLAEVSVDTVKNALKSTITDAATEYSELKTPQVIDDLNKEIERGRIPIVRW